MQVWGETTQAVGQGNTGLAAGPPLKAGPVGRGGGGRSPRHRTRRSEPVGTIPAPYVGITKGGAGVQGEDTLRKLLRREGERHGADTLARGQTA